MSRTHPLRSIMSTDIEPVTIVGAGLSGLVLARYLQLNGIPCVVYERETSANSRLQGGTLDMHEGGGLKALIETGLLELARPKMRVAGESLKIMDKTGKVYRDENDYRKSGEVEVMYRGSSGRPEIDR